MLGNFGDSAAPIDADGWLHTGDLAHPDEDGYLWVTGRSKDLILRGGENIAPLSVERALMGVPGVLDAAVFGLPHPDLGEESPSWSSTVPLPPGPTSASTSRPRCGRISASFAIPRAGASRPRSCPCSARKRSTSTLSLPSCRRGTGPALPRRGEAVGEPCRLAPEGAASSSLTAPWGCGACAVRHTPCGLSFSSGRCLRAQVRRRRRRAVHDAPAHLFAAARLGGRGAGRRALRGRAFPNDATEPGIDCAAAPAIARTSATPHRGTRLGGSFDGTHEDDLIGRWAAVRRDWRDDVAPRPV